MPPSPDPLTVLSGRLSVNKTVLGLTPSQLHKDQLKVIEEQAERHSEVTVPSAASPSQVEGHLFGPNNVEIPQRTRGLEHDCPVIWKKTRLISRYWSEIRAQR